MSLKNIVFVAAKRTPFAKFGASFVGLSATDLAVVSAQAALKQAGLQAADLQASIYGNVLQTSADAIYLARHVALKIEAPQEVSALTVNRLCGSGFEAIVQGAYELQNSSQPKAVLVGGSENMSQAPYVLRGARWGYRMGPSDVEDSLQAGLTDSYVQLPMALTAEKLGEKYAVTREDVDHFAFESQQRAIRAWNEGIFSNEVCEVEVAGRKGTQLIAKDEHFREDVTLEGVKKLPPLFKKDGLVTAANASGIVDGAASLVMCTEEFAAERGLKVMGRLKSWGYAGCDPSIMGIGPVPATKRALAHYEQLWGSKLSVQDFKRVEVNEAFAAQYLSVEKELALDRQKTNVNGGAIAIGHPLAASGARLSAHMLYELGRQGGGLGLVSACIGGGQGMSLVIEVS